MIQAAPALLLRSLLALVVAGCASCTRDEPSVSSNLRPRWAPQQAFGTVPGRSIDTAQMVWIQGGTFTMGSEAASAKPDEGPEVQVELSGFYMDRYEVTNADFKRFVSATDYVTVAEREVDWEQLRPQLPPGTPKPPDSSLAPGSLVFSPAPSVTDLRNVALWWRWQRGANWRHPQGPGSSIVGKDSLPVVHIAYADALAYALWAGKSLPTEAEWEYACRAGSPSATYAWGEQLRPQGQYRANYFQGQFPGADTGADGYAGVAAVGSYPPSTCGLYDMVGNVWEWTQDWYRPDAHSLLAGLVQGCRNPQGPAESYDPLEPAAPKRVIKGGSYLCSPAYCSAYRPAARMPAATDTGMEHLGFRCVWRPDKQP